MILGAGLFYIIAGAPSDSDWTDAAKELYAIETGLITFYANYERYPAEGEGLEALVTRPNSIEESDWYGPFLDEDISLIDPWGLPYVYYPGGELGAPYTLYSFGADRRPGGEGAAQDIKIYFD